MLASTYILEQLNYLLGQIKGVKGGKDIEYVHQARVASRRMRAAFDMLDICFAKDRVGKWNKIIKKLTKELGQARDKDVQIEHLTEILQNLDKKEYKPGIKRLILRLKQDRIQIQPYVLKTIRRIEAKKVLNEIKKETRLNIQNLKLEKVDIKSVFVLNQIILRVHQKLQNVYLFEQTLKNPDDHSGHHELRIAAKKLRYCMEISSNVLEKGFEKYISGIKHLQKLLGELHDYAVWLEFLKLFSKQEKELVKLYYGREKPYDKIRPGLNYLKRKFHLKHKNIFRETVKYKQQLDTDKFFDNMIFNIEQCQHNYLKQFYGTKNNQNSLN